MADRPSRPDRPAAVEQLPVLVWRFDGTTGPGRGWDTAIVERLQAEGARVRVVDPHRQDPLAIPARGHVLSGGATAVGDTDASRTAHAHVRRLVDHAAATDVPVIGICLGMHHLAAALLDRVASGPVHPDPHRAVEVGVVDVIDDRGVHWRTATFHSHHVDAEVLRVDGVHHLAGNRHTPMQAFGRGSVLGVQFHPELAREHVADAVLANPSWVQDPVGTAGRIRRGQQVGLGTLRRWLLDPLGL